MARYEGRVRWQIFGAFLLAQTVLLGLLGGDVSSLRQASFGRSVLGAGSVLGLLLSIVWALTFLRYTRFYTLRNHQARAIESETDYELFTEGYRFSHGETIDRLEPLDADQYPRWIEQKLHGRVVGTVLIVLFALPHVGLLGIALGCW